jgi:UDP-glucose 4-epimerase
MNALVTGGAGFIGSHVCEQLIAKHGPHCRVVALDDLSGGAAANVPTGVQFIQGSITDYALLSSLFKAHRFDYVFHIAAYAAEGLSHYIRRFNYENNLVGSINLINLSVLHGIRCFLFTSSIAVYGSHQLPMVEELTPHPEDPYGIAKYAVELDLQAAHRLFGLNYIIFRPHNVYGRRQNVADKYRNVIGIFMGQLLRGEAMTVFGDGLQERAFTHVSDVAPYIVAIVDKPACYNGVFNVGASRRTTVLQLADLTARSFGVPSRVVHLPERPEVRFAYADHSKLSRLIDVGPELPLEAGLADMAQWARTMPIQNPSQFGGIEIPTGLPPSWKS